jgi:hypothetical protein
MKGLKNIGFVLVSFPDFITVRFIKVDKQIRQGGPCVIAAYIKALGIEEAR